MSTFVIDLHDRPGALERLLNKCRRKNLEIRTLQFGPGEAPGVRRVVVAFDEGCPPAVKVIANLAKVHDVLAVAPVEGAQVETSNVARATHAA